MNKLVRAVAVVACVGLWGQNANAGGATSLSLTFAPTGVFVGPSETTVTSTLTATVFGPPPGGTFNAVFTSPGFNPPDPLIGFNPTSTPGVCSAAISSFMCTVMNLDFTMPGPPPGGTFTFTAMGTVNMGGTVITSETASFAVTVPEPGALALLSLGLVALGIVWRKSASAKPK